MPAAMPIDLADPFAQLERSHRRLEERLDDLATAARGLDRGEARDALREVCGFFARAVKRHEEDEERSLFPRLAGVAELAPVLDALAREHREHEALHARLESLVADLESGVPADVLAGDLADVASRLATAYRSHIADEERTLFPAARATLDDAALRAIADEMEQRREAGRGGGRRRR
jgi:hemerythrin-like domain-containing protein